MRYVTLSEVIASFVTVWNAAHHLCWLYSPTQLWASVRVPNGSMPTTQSPKREVVTIVLQPKPRAC